MEAAGKVSGNADDGNGNAVRRLQRQARMWEVITFVAVVLISPASFILGLPLGIAPQDWLATWTHWTVVFITVALIATLLGFETALSHRLKARHIQATGSS